MRRRRCASTNGRGGIIRCELRELTREKCLAIVSPDKRRFGREVTRMKGDHESERLLDSQKEVALTEAMQVIQPSGVALSINAMLSAASRYRTT